MGLHALLSSRLPRGVLASLGLHAAFVAVTFALGAGSDARQRVEVAVETDDPAPALERLAAPALAPAADVAPPADHDPYPVPPSHGATPRDRSAPHVVATGAAPTPAGAPPEPVIAATTAPPRFTIALGNMAGTAAPPDRAPPPRPAAEAAVPEALADVPAHLLASAGAVYPPEARANEIEADVPLEIVVDGAGRVVGARVTRRAGFGFDGAALSAVRGYRFSPAERAGKAVRVRMRWSVAFRLR